jgi:hypothetical protein
MKTVQHKRGTAAILTANNPTIAAGEIVVETDTGRIKIGDGSTAWTSLAYLVPASADIITASVLAAKQHQTTAVLDVFDRVNINTAVAPVSGAQYWSFFTPSYSLTITQITMASVNAASSVTLARFGLYTANAAGEATLVARTASDTTIFSASNTIYTRSLDSTGGYPTSYALTAGTRYAVSMCLVSSGGTGTVSAVSVASVIGALSPRVQGVRTGLTDLVTSQGSGQYNGSVAHAYWARLS